jgi:hypothetical protein
MQRDMQGAEMALNGVKDVPLSLTLTLIDGKANRYPQAELFAPGTGTPFATVDLVNRSGGYYEQSYTFTSVGKFSAVFIVYKDAGHTQVDTKYGTVNEDIIIDSSSATDIQASLDELLGLQENKRIFSPVYDASSNLLSCTVKTYPTKADAIADTNAIATYTMTATYNANDEMQTYQMVKEP